MTHRKKNANSKVFCENNLGTLQFISYNLVTSQCENDRNILSQSINKSFVKVM